MPDQLAKDFAAFQAVDPHVQAAAQATGLDPVLLHKVIAQESAYDPNAVNAKSGATGLMQLMPGTAKDMGVQNSLDPAQNVMGGAKYLKSLLTKYGGDTNKALAAYNAGPGNVDNGRAASFPETQDYVRKVGGGTGVTTPTTPPDELSRDVADWQNQQKLQGFRAAHPAPTPNQNAWPPAQIQNGHVVPTSPVTAPPISGLWDMIKHPVENAPAIGGMLGSVAGSELGGFPAAGLAALGGAGGEAAKQLINRFVYGQGGPTTPLDAAKAIGMQGAIQGGMELGGRTAAAIPAALGKGLVQHALNPKKWMLEKTPDLAAKYAESGLPLSSGGLATAESATNASANAATTGVHNFSAANPDLVMPTEKVIQSLGPTAATIDATVNRDPAATSALGRFITEISDANPVGLNPDRTLQVTRSAGKSAHDLFLNSQSAAPRVPTPADTQFANVHGAARSQLSDWMPPGTPQMPQGIDAQMAQTQNAGDIEAAIRNALDPSNQRGFLTRHGLPALAMAGAAGTLGYATGHPFMMAAPLYMAGHLAATISPRVEAAIGRGLYNGPGQLPAANMARMIQIALNQKDQPPEPPQ